MTATRRTVANNEEAKGSLLYCLNGRIIKNILNQFHLVSYNLYARLETKKVEKKLHKLARQGDKAGKDVQHVRVIKDENGNMIVNSEAVLKRWKEHFEKLMNEENNREPRTEEVEVVNEEVNCVSREVKNALRRMKKGKAVGPDELPVEVWKCMGKMGMKFLTRLYNRLLMGERMPEE